MIAAKPATDIVGAADAKQHFDELVERVGRTQSRVLVERDGVPAAAIVSADDLRHLERLDAEWEAGVAAMMAISEAFKDVPVEEIERGVAKAIAEVRAENREIEHLREQVAARSA